MQNVPPKPAHRAAKISNQTRLDFKYPTDFRFQRKCRILSDLDLESITSPCTIECLLKSSP